MTAPIVTTEEVRALIPIRAGNTSFDAKLNMLIMTASSAIETAINRELDKTPRTEFFRTPDTSRYAYDLGGTMNETGSFSDPRRVRYNLKAFNIDMTQPFEARYDPDHVFGDDTVIDPSFYSVNAAEGYVSFRYGFDDSFDSLKITYTGGFAVNAEGCLSDTIPSDIKMACLSQVMHLFSKFTPDNIGKESDTVQGFARKAQGGNKFANLAGLVPEAVSLISRYKALGIGLY